LPCFLALYVQLSASRVKLLQGLIYICTVLAVNLKVMAGAN
jgi:hypothetical protein